MTALYGNDSTIMHELFELQKITHFSTASIVRK
jgi:hypothetical protein